MSLMVSAFDKSRNSFWDGWFLIYLWCIRLLHFFLIACITSAFFDSKDSLPWLVNRELGTTENSYWPMYFSRFGSGLFLDTTKKYTNSHVTEIKLQIFILRKKYILIAFFNLFFVNLLQLIRVLSWILLTRP